MSDILDSLFPMRDERGATLQLIKIVVVLAAIFLFPLYRMLLHKVFIVMRRPLFMRIWKLAALICIGIIVYVPLYNYLLRPTGVFWLRRIDAVWQLLSSHSLLAFWVLFVLYLLAFVVVSLKWCYPRIRRNVKYDGNIRIAPGHDAPIRRIPETEKDRNSFVKVIAEAVASADVRHEAEFIGIFGEWGSGKTTVANSLKVNVLRGLAQYKGLEKACFVSFNPMEFNNATDALSGLFKEIVAQLKKRPELCRLAKAFDAYSTSLCLRRVKIGLGTIGETLEMTRQWIYLKVFRSIKCKQRLRLELRSNLVRLVLIVDDIERLPCKDVFSIINFLKANVDLPNVVVLILSDQEHLYKSLSLAMGDENRRNKNRVDEGRAYGEKFIQRHLDVPRFSRGAIIEYFKSKLQDVLMGAEVLEYNDDFITVGDFATTIRKVNKILGSMWATVRYCCHYTDNNVLPYHVGDLAALTAIAEVEPDVYRNLRAFMSRVWADSDVNAFNANWGIPESVIDKWINENVIHKENRQFIKVFLLDRLLFKELTDKDGRLIYRIDGGMSRLEANYSYRLASPSWFNLYFGDLPEDDIVRPADLLAFNRCISEMSVPEELLRNKIEDNSLLSLLDVLLGHAEFASEKELETFIETLLWLSCQKYGLRFFSKMSGQGFYENTVYMAIYRVWLSYWTRVIKSLPSSRKGIVGDLIVKACRGNPACHFIRQLLSNDSPNHNKGTSAKGTSAQALELGMFTDAQYEELVDLYLDSVQELQDKGQIFDDPCYLDLLRAWNIALIRRSDTIRYEKFRASIERSLKTVTNILKMRIFYIRSAIYAGDGEEIVDGIYFNGISIQSVERLFGLQLLRKIASTLEVSYMSLSQEDKVLSAALTFVVAMDLDPNKCSAKQQIEYLRDIFSSQEHTKMDGGSAGTFSSLHDEFMGAVSKFDFTQQLAALGLAYQVKSVEKRDDTIDLGHGLYVQTHELIMRGGASSDTEVYCPVLIYDAARMVLNEVAANEEYLAASLHVSRNYLVPLAKSICADKGKTYECFESFVKQNKELDPSRISQCAKALYYGALGDYSSAAQLLIPQVEHLIRGILKSNDIQERKGAHKGLGSLLYAPGIESVMSMVVLFEMRALFVARNNGLNIRNLFAHGELLDYKSDGLEAFYIWWFFVRMVVDFGGSPINKV